VIVPSALATALPCAGVLTAVTVRLSPSRSVSFASTATLRAVSSTVVAASLTATGTSFTGVTLTLTVAVALPPRPSPIV
jgi:hypothetical protein